MLKTTERRYYRIDRRQIHFLRFILEGYDGVAVLTTIDPSEGLVVLHIGPGCQTMVDAIIQDLKKQVRIEPVEDATWQQKGAV
jgi:phospholipid N-methyltransferase